MRYSTRRYLEYSELYTGVYFNRGHENVIYMCVQQMIFVQNEFDGLSFEGDVAATGDSPSLFRRVLATSGNCTQTAQDSAATRLTGESAVAQLGLSTFSIPVCFAGPPSPNPFLSCLGRCGAHRSIPGHSFAAARLATSNNYY